MSNRQAYVSWIFCCPEEECIEIEHGHNGTRGVIRVLATTRARYAAKVAALTAKGWSLTPW